MLTAGSGVMRSLSYILPIRSERPAGADLVAYVRALAERLEVIVADGSPAEALARNAVNWAPPVIHIQVDADLRDLVNGKVAGVLTGLRRASHEHVVIADDDVRYDDAALDAVQTALGRADVVRPQNYFDPLPWHALVDTGRVLLNRVSGGDWPGTLGVRRSLMLRTKGYDGGVLFENLELVRTVRAAGGKEAQLMDVYVRRLPPATGHFWSQRIRQAYDEFARPPRLAVWLAILPASAALIASRRRGLLLAGLGVTIAAAEAGRRRANGRQVFPVAASVVAPLWIAERAVCSWLALGARLALGGVPYRGRIVSRAANPTRLLRARFADPRDPAGVSGAM
jgi:hypothetical protein